MSQGPASTRRSRRSRAERRQKGRSAGPTPRRSELPAPTVLARRALAVAWWVAAAALLVFTARAVERKITWYLAVDQFGYLTFAHDLLRGNLFHHWPPLDALASDLPPRVDVLVQTYVYDKGILYCRYAPGFALLLAGWLELFGDDGAPFLNPTVFIALLIVALAFQIRVFRSPWRATAGVALTVLLSGSTYLFWWALTLVRDLSTHLAGLLGLFLLLRTGSRPLAPRRAAGAGAALGFAVSIRPDAVLYLVPGASLAAYRWYRERAGRWTVGRGVGAGALGLLVGLAPFLAYNWAATGNPLRPTQGMELQEFLPPASSPSADATSGVRVGYPSPPPAPAGAWHGGTRTAVQGGGLRLENLARVLPGNVAEFRRAYGDLLLGLAGVGALVAAVNHPALFLAAVPYGALALLFFSCWSKPDPRYFAGVHVFLPMLIVEGALGTLDVIRSLWRRRADALARAIGVVFGGFLIAGAALLEVPDNRSVVATVAVLVGVVGALAALAAATWPARRIAIVAAPLLALALVVVAGQRALAGLGTRATFQRGEALRAQATFRRAVEPGAVVITTEDVGRPAENIEYYSGVAHAFYLTDLMRWHIPLARAAELLARAGMKPYLLIPTIQAGRPAIFGSLAVRNFVPELVADIAPQEAIDYFVAARFYPRGIRMELWRLNWQGEASKKGPETAP